MDKTKSKQVPNSAEAPKKVSKMAQMWAKYPEGSIKILDMKAVLQ